jgi:type IV pilus assembly protein PilC
MASESASGRVKAFWRRVLVGPGEARRIELYEEFAPMLTAGIGIRETLRSCADRHGGAKRRAVDLLADGIDRDVDLSKTMRAHPEIFTPLEAAMVATGERTGRLDAAFRAAAAQLERSMAVRNRLFQALAYPTLVVHCFILMVSLVGTFQGGSFLALALPSFGLLWGGTILLVSAHAALRDSPAYARLVSRLPVIGRVVRSSALARFSRAFAALHGGGISYDESLRTAADASGSALLKKDAETAVAVLAGGAPLPAALAAMSSIPQEDRGLLVAGEQSGDLEGAANRVADLEQERFEVVAKRATALLPGCLTLLMGLAVAWFAFSFYGGLYRGL